MSPTQKNAWLRTLESYTSFAKRAKDEESRKKENQNWDPTLMTEDTAMWVNYTDSSYTSSLQTDTAKL